MINGDLKTHSYFSTRVLNRTAWLMMGLIFWVSAGFIFQYKRHWFGNKQEMFPSALMPGFLRNKINSDSSYYYRYEVHIIACEDTLFVMPQEFFKEQGLFKTQQIFTNNNDSWRPYQMSKFPNANKVCFCKDLKQYINLEKREEHFLITRTEVCYDME